MLTTDGVVIQTIRLYPLYFNNRISLYFEIIGLDLISLSYIVAILLVLDFYIC